MSEPLLAQVVMFAGNFAPRGWALCDGQVMPIAENTALFSLLGTTYGGDGRATFALPDFRGRVAIHPGQGSGRSPYQLGESGGSETLTLTAEQMPAHNHLVTADGDPKDTVASNPSGHRLGPTGSSASGSHHIYSRTDPLTQPVTMHPQMIGVTGGGQPHANVQPFLTINFIIALQGIFPARD